MYRKIWTPLLFIGVLAFSSCRQSHPAHQAQQPINTANEVKVEAPDANVDSQQGYALPGLDHGLIQSPINILSYETQAAGRHEVTVHFQDEIKAVENLGHTVQLDFETGSSITFDGQSYEFKQLHFHTPSEHLIDGMTFPMEMHIVNTRQNDQGAPEYLVIGILFKMGRESRFIDEFINAIPVEEHTTEPLQAGAVKLTDLYADISKDKLRGFYHYEGSLTTPPYTEAVQWFVDKNIFEASPQQIQLINKIEGNNARHVQALYGRKVEEM